MASHTEVDVLKTCNAFNQTLEWMKADGLID